MDVLIFEPEYAGHHFRWVAYVLEAFLSRGDRVALATSKQALASKEYREFLEGFRDQIEIVPIREPAAKRVARYHRVRHVLHALQLLRIVHRRQPELVCVPYFDAMLMPLALLRLIGLGLDASRRRIQVVLMRGEFAYPEIRTTAAWRLHPKWRFKEWALRRALRSVWFSQVLITDETTFRYMQGWPRAQTRLQHCPEPVSVSFPDRDLARRELGWRESVKIVGCWGVLDTRKGIDLLLRAFAARPFRPEERLLLVGRQSRDIAALWAGMLAEDPSLAERVILVDRFVSTMELQRYVAAIDVAAVVYPAHVGASRVVIEAAAAAKPILASEFGWIGRVVKENHLGRCCDVRSRAELAKGLDWAFSTPDFDAAAARRLVRRNSVAEFQERILCEDSSPGASRVAE